MKDHELDRIIQASVTNFFSFGKKDHRIKLIGFDAENPAHMALFHIALIAKNTFHYDIYVDGGGFMKFRKAKKKLKKRTDAKIFKLKTYDVGLPNCDEFVGFVEEAFNAVGAFKEIYERFYKDEA